MKRIIVAEGDGQSVRRVAKEFVAQVRIYAETDYSRRPDLELTVRPDGSFELLRRHPLYGNTSVIAEGWL